MTRKLRPVEMVVDPQLQDSLFQLAVPMDNGAYTTVGALVESALDSLRVANEVLAGNEMVSLTARALMRDQKRRGVPSLRVSAEGRLVLHVHYGEERERRGASVGGAGLPSLQALRDEAAEKGVDIADLGRQKRKIMERLASHSSPAISSDPPGRLRDEVQTRPLGKVKLPPLR